MSRSCKRLGLLVPSSDITMEWEFCRYLPPDIALHVTRMPLGQVTQDSLARMAEDSTKALNLIMDAEPHLIVYGCTSGSFIGGKGYDQMIEERITAQTGVPSITTAHAVVDCLKVLNTNRVVVCTPYIEEIDRIEEKFLRDSGFEVTSIHGMNIVKDIEIGKLDSQEVYRFAVQHDDSNAKTMFISCTNLRTLDIIPLLHEKLAKPVVSSNLATLWSVCRRLGGGADARIFDALRSLDAMRIDASGSFDRRTDRPT